MIFRKICNDTSTMSATELAHNFVFVKNREAWYRDFDREIPVRDLMRDLCETRSTGGHRRTHGRGAGRNSLR